MPRTKSTTKTVGRPRKKISPSPKPVVAVSSQFSFDRLKQNKPLVGAIGIGIIVLLLLAFPFRFLVVPAIVNGQPIFSWQYVNELHKKAGEEILTQMINQKLLEQEISGQNIQVAQVEIDQEIKKIEASIGTESGGLEAALSFQGLTKEDLIKQITFQLQLEKLIKGTITINDEDVKKELSSNAAIYKNLSEADAATTAAETLRQQKMSQAFAEWFQNLRKNAKIINSFSSPASPLPGSPQ